MAIKKLTEAEIQKLKDLQSNNRALVQELGQISLAQINLDKRSANAQTFLTNLRQEEDKVSSDLQSKYGSGNINLDTGEIDITEVESTGTETVDLPEIDSVDLEES